MNTSAKRTGYENVNEVSIAATMRLKDATHHLESGTKKRSFVHGQSCPHDSISLGTLSQRDKAMHLFKKRKINMNDEMEDSQKMTMAWNLRSDCFDCTSSSTEDILLRSIRQSKEKHNKFDEASKCNVSLLSVMEKNMESAPLSKRTSYLEALRSDSFVMERESKASRFLELEELHVSSAAKRLLSYWRIRTTLFDESAFLPMRQVDGALNSDDHRALKSGFITILPKHQNGHTVLCCDASRLEGRFGSKQLRSFFYMLHVALDTSSTKNGVCILFIMNRLSFERIQQQSMMFDILKVFPLKLASIHIVRQPARLGMHFFDDKVAPFMNDRLKKSCSKILMHRSKKASDLRNDLERHGFSLPDLPRSLGGGWTYQNFQSWQENRRIFESTLPSNGNATSSSVVNSKPAAAPAPRYWDFAVNVPRNTYSISAKRRTMNYVSFPANVPVDILHDGSISMSPRSRQHNANVVNNSDAFNTFAEQRNRHIAELHRYQDARFVLLRGQSSDGEQLAKIAVEAKAKPYS